MTRSLHRGEALPPDEPPARAASLDAMTRDALRLRVLELEARFSKWHRYLQDRERRVVERALSEGFRSGASVVERVAENRRRVVESQRGTTGESIAFAFGILAGLAAALVLLG